MKESTRKLAVGTGVALFIWFCFFALLFFISGCSMKERESTLNQTQRESVAGRGFADVIRELDQNPSDVTIETTAKDGTTVKVTQPVQNTQRTKSSAEVSENSDSSAKGSSHQSDSFPAWVAALGWCAVGVLVLGVIWFIIHFTKSGRVAYEYGDAVLARKIQSTMSKLAATTNPEVMQALSTELAELQAERVELNRP